MSAVEGLKRKRSHEYEGKLIIIPNKQMKTVVNEGRKLTFNLQGGKTFYLQYLVVQP